MLLRAERLMDILADLRRCRADEWRGGRRGACRVGVRYSLQVRTLPGGEPVRAWLRDLSSTGVGLCCPEPLAAGTTLALVLVRPGQGGEGALEVPCVVRRCTAAAAGVYHVGASFSSAWTARLQEAATGAGGRAA